VQKLDVSVGDLVRMIELGELRLPELQRRYVWPATRARDLLDSLYRGYPSGSILVWETTEEVPARGFAVEQRASGYLTQKLLLDGQQRLTCLAATLQGKALTFKNHVRSVDIAFNLDHPAGPPTEVTEVEDDWLLDEDGDADEEATGAPSVQQRLRTRTFAVASKALLADPRWVKVSDIFNPEVREWDLLKPLVGSPDHPDYERYSQRLRRVKRISDYQYVMHLLDRDLPYEEVAEIFVRVNSLGMKLRGSDLAMAQITARWQGSLEKFEDFADECEKLGFSFDLGLLVRTLVVFATGQSRFRTVSGLSALQLEQSWQKTKGGLRFAINFLRTNANVEDESLLSSPLLVIPIAVLAVERRFDFSDRESRELLHWLFVANATGHYSVSSETVLDMDLSMIFRRGGAGLELLDLVRQQQGRTRFSAAYFARRGPRNPLFQTTYLAVKHAGARDWRSGLGLSLAHSGKSHYIQVHHIFPKAATKDLDPAETNEIANLAFISGSENRHISDKLPDVYLAEIVRRRGAEILTAQGIPTDPELWKLENFSRFLEYRRAQLARIVNEFLEGVASEGRRASRDIAGLIAGGEGPDVEFKETARFNVRSGSQDRALEGAVVKTLAGFLNANGGTLVIGVDDDGTPVGVERDLATLSRPDRDGFEQFLRNLLNVAIGKDLSSRVTIEFPTVDGVMLCAVSTPGSARPVWLAQGSDKVFYVRSGNTTVPLDGEEAHRYIQEHWDG
jgi:hypothetical protein